jgi:hypothetical protein
VTSCKVAAASYSPWNAERTAVMDEEGPLAVDAAGVTRCGMSYRQ